jgi:hypothetical protein
MNNINTGLNQTGGMDSLWGTHPSWLETNYNYTACKNADGLLELTL